MNEHRRQAYLNAMGIQAYYPRVLLPQARPSPVYDLTPLVESVQSDPDNGQMGVATEFIDIVASAPAKKSFKGVPANTRQLLDSSADEKPGVPAAPTDSSTQPEQVRQSAITDQARPDQVQVADDADNIRFCLRYYRIGVNAEGDDKIQLAVIDEIPFAQPDEGASLELLRAILLALGLPGEGLELASESFDWPLAPDLPPDARGSGHARQALKGFIKQRSQRDGFSNLLVFASQVTGLIHPHGKDSRIGDVKPGGADYHLCLTHSLHAMLAHPMLKKEVWEHLQALRQRLKAGQLNN